MRHLARRFAAAAAALAVAILPVAARAATTLTSTAITTDNLTANGNVSFNDASADTIAIGQNGGTPDTVQIAGDVSLTDTNWSVTALGAASFASLNLNAGSITNLGVTGASLTRTGAHSLTLTTTAATAVTLPTTGTLATLAGTETFTNKTLTNPRISSAVLDSNGAAILAFSPIATAVNALSVSNSNAGFPVALVATGTDVDVSMFVQPKGNGEVIVSNGVTNADQLAIRAQVAVTTAGNKGTLTSSDLTATRTWTLPDSTGNLVIDAAVQTLTNKTLTTPRVGTGILDSNGAKILGLNPVATAVNELTVTNAQTGNAPILSTSGIDANVDLRLQTKGSGLFFMQNSAANADQFVFSMPTGATSFAGTFTASDLTATRVWTFPDADGTVVLDAATQTLTNKTLNLPRISGIKDTNGADLLAFNPTASAVNNFQMFNAAAASDPSLLVIGSDANIDMRLQAKGTGTVMLLNSSSNADMFAFQPAAGAATFLGTVTSADLTGNQTWTLPNASGTVALTTDITGASGFTDGGAAVTLVTANDNVGIGSTPNGKLHVTGTLNTAPVMVVQAAASQSGNLQEWKDAAGTAILARLTNVGDLRIRGNGGTSVIESDTSTTASLFNGVPTTVNFAGAATALNMGASSGTTTIGNALTVNRGATILTPATTTKSLIVRRILNQTAVLQEWQNESSVALAFLDQDGSFTTTAGLTANGLVALGDASTDRVNVAGELRIGVIAADPSGTNGLMYYNSSTNKFRCFEGSAWKDCDTAAGVSVTGTPGTGQVTFFTGAATTTADANFFWDNTNKRLGIGTNAPPTALTVVASSAVSGNAVTSLQIDTMTTGTPTAGFGSSLLFRAEDTNGTADLAASIDAVFIDPTHLSEDSEIRFFTRSGGGALTNALTIGNSGNLTVAGSTTLGDASGDAVTLNAGTMALPNNLNVDGDTFVIDATNNHVGIGDASPLALLTVGTGDAFQVNASGNVSTTGTLTVGTSGSALLQHKSVLVTLDLPTTSSGACSTHQVDASGIGLSASAGDMVAIVPAFNDTAWNFGQVTIFVEIAGTLKITYCNHNASPLDPPSGQYRISHWRY